MSWLNQIHNYGRDNFPIVLKIGVLLPDALSRWNFNRADWVQFDHLCKERLTLDMVRRISGKYKTNTVRNLKLNNNGITDVKRFVIHWPNN